MLSTPKKTGTMDKHHRLIRDKVKPRRLFPDKAKFGHEQAKEVDTMESSPVHRQHSSSPGIGMGIGTERYKEDVGKKVDDGKVKEKLKRTLCNCPNCVNRFPKK
jgi:hypothetical protein